MDGTIEVPKELIEMAGVEEDSILIGEGEPSGTVHPYLTDRCKQRNLEYNGKKVGKYGFSFGKRVSPIHCEIVDITKPSKTIISTYDHQPRLFVAQKVKEEYYLRPYTVDELKQIQGFPKDYVMEGSLKDQVVQLGNAVPPPLIQRIVESISP
jgi:DNA (cytosine-5)-methyltransferase 1